MAKIVVCLFSLLSFASAASAQQLLNESDTLHVFLAEVVNRSAVAKNVSFSLDLCAAPQANPEKAECMMLFATDAIAIGAKEAGKDFINVKPGSNSQKIVGKKVNEIAAALAAKLKLKADQLDYRFAATIYDVDAKANKVVVERQFSKLPDLTQAPDDKHRIQNRHQFEKGKEVQGRILVVIGRKIRG